MKYVGMLRIYISQVSIRVVRYISIKYIYIRIYIYKVQKVPVLARCNILLKCFSYDVFMGYINKQLISKVNIFVLFDK